MRKGPLVPERRLAAWLAIFVLATSPLCVPAVSQSNRQLQGGVSTYQGIPYPAGPSCSQADADTQRQRELVALNANLSRAQDELARTRAMGQAMSGIWQAQVDTANTRIQAEEAYYTCKTKRIAQGRPGGPAQVERDCRMCEGQSWRQRTRMACPAV